MPADREWREGVMKKKDDASLFCCAHYVYNPLRSCGLEKEEADNPRTLAEAGLRRWWWLCTKK